MLVEPRGCSLPVRAWPGQGSIKDYIALTKPGISAAVLLWAAAGYLLACRFYALPFRWESFLHMILGTALTSAGAGALNMLLEIEPDGIMQRTKDRPLPASRLWPHQALFLGLSLGALGVVHLAFKAGLAAGFLAGAGLALYLALYTPLKKLSAFAIAVGAVSGAVPPLIGWSAAAGTVSGEAASLFLLLFLWQFPHVFSLAWIYREDYARARFKLADGLESAPARALAFSALLVPAALAPWASGLAGKGYLIGSALLSGVLLRASVRFFRGRDEASARHLFLVSIIYSPLLLGCLLLAP